MQEVTDGFLTIIRWLVYLNLVIAPFCLLQVYLIKRRHKD